MKNQTHQSYIKSTLYRVLSVLSYKELPKTFVIFYSVGILLYLIPFTRDLFKAVTPLSLIFVIASLLWHHKKWDRSFVLFIAIVITSSFLIEAVGVETGAIFGQYKYLNALGPKVLQTPLIIGVNWLMLTYCSAAIMEYIRRRSSGTVDVAIRIIGGALIMVMYDVAVELVAPQMGMWQFVSDYPPVENFVMWFVMALFYHIIFAGLK
ncbi:MAG: carotenoid biosynthesis protein, partial [Bacteroidales bacterium]|nr:carotenoid biosynthesis protein [Bacteroidales bacterium]